MSYRERPTLSMDCLTDAAHTARTAIFGIHRVDLNNTDCSMCFVDLCMY